MPNHVDQIRLRVKALLKHLIYTDIRETLIDSCTKPSPLLTTLSRYFPLSEVNIPEEEEKSDI